MNNWYVLCTREQTDNLTKSCDPTDKRNGLKRNTDDEKEKKEKEQRYDMTFPKKTEVNFALRFETFDRPPYNKSSSCSFRNILEGYASTETGRHHSDVHDLHNRVHIVVGGEMGDVLSSSNDPIFLLHHAFVDVSMKNGCGSLIRVRMCYPLTMHQLVTTEMTSLCRCFRFTLTNRCSRSLSSSVMITMT